MDLHDVPTVIEAGHSWWLITPGVKAQFARITDPRECVAALHLLASAFVADYQCAIHRSHLDGERCLYPEDVAMVPWDGRVCYGQWATPQELHVHSRLISLFERVETIPGIQLVPGFILQLDPTYPYTMQILRVIPIDAVIAMGIWTQESLPLPISQDISLLNT